jgi:transglutaminase-like putative cysteine protease
LLGLLALMAPLPLPFNLVVGWASVSAYALAIVVFLLRTLDGRQNLLPYWAMNVLGFLYLPFLVLDLTLLRQGRFLQPLVHLAMFALVVKLFGMHREKDKWHVLLTIFFVFVASAGTSVHPSVFLYLVVFLGLSVLLLTRFAGLHAVTEFRPREVQPPRVPLRAYVAGTVVLVILGAAPIFFFMPRLRRPYVWAPTAGSGSSMQVSGFSDRMDLDVIGRVRSSRAVLLRFTYNTPVPFPTERRFKSGVFDRFEGGTWRKSRRAALSVTRSPDGLFHLARERSSAWMAVWQRTMGDGRVILPVEARAVDLAGNGLVMEDSGALLFLLPPPGTVDFRVGLGSSPLIPSPPPSAVGGSVPELDRVGVSPEIEALAADVIGEGAPIERVRRAEEYLLQNYNYTLNLGSRPTDRPVERFLLETREGHCEHFVSAMVLMLRSQGIPARVVTGYLGADYNEWQRYFIVRQSHAHAWVEAWVEGRGWQIFDPTPPDGRPIAERSGWGAFLDQAWDSLLFRWDRYVLTYGFYDQVDVFIRFRDLLEGFLRIFGGGGGGETSASDDSPPETAQTVEESDQPEWISPRPMHGLPFLLAALAAALWFWWQRERLSATMLYRRLRARLARAVPETDDSVPPLEVERRLSDLFPAARSQTRRVIELYLEESFGGRRLEDEELVEAREAFREAKKRWRKTA